MYKKCFKYQLTDQILPCSSNCNLYLRQCDLDIKEPSIFLSAPTELRPLVTLPYYYCPDMDVSPLCVLIFRYKVPTVLKQRMDNC